MRECGRQTEQLHEEWFGATHRAGLLEQRVWPSQIAHSVQVPAASRVTLARLCIGGMMSDPQFPASPRRRHPVRLRGLAGPRREAAPVHGLGEPRPGANRHSEAARAARCPSLNHPATEDSNPRRQVIRLHPRTRRPRSTPPIASCEIRPHTAAERHASGPAPDRVHGRVPKGRDRVVRLARPPCPRTRILPSQKTLP